MESNTYKHFFIKLFSKSKHTEKYISYGVIWFFC